MDVVLLNGSLIATSTMVIGLILSIMKWETQ